MNAVCSHMSGYLPKGEMRDHNVICPVHKANFDITTGKVMKNVPSMMKLASHKEATDLRTYEVQTVAGEIRLKI